MNAAESDEVSKIRISYLFQNEKLSDMVEYRKKLLAQFEKAQVEYLQRKKERGHSQLTAQKLRQTLKSFSKDKELETENPPQPNFIEARQFHKLGKVQSCIVLKRLFVIDNDKFIQYKNENSSQPTQKINIAQSKARLEILAAVCKDPKTRWTDTTASFRVCITLEDKKLQKKRVVFVYSNDLHELKALLVKFKYASSAGLRNELAISMVKLSIVYNMLQFEVMWRDLLEVYNRRNNRLVSFQMLSSRLIDVAGLQWQRGRLALQNVEKYVLDKMEHNRIERQKRIMNVGGQLKIKSTMKLGRGKPGSRDGQDFQISSILNLKVEQLVNVVRTRRSRRVPQAQLEVEYLRKLHLQGYPATEVTIQKNDKHGKLSESLQIKDQNARIYFQGENMLIEDLNLSKLQKQTFASHKLTHVIPLADISLITSDLIHDVHMQKDMDNQREYQIVLHGLFLNQTLKSTELTNVLAEHCKLTQLRHSSFQRYKIQVREIQLPVRFVSQFNNKGFLKVRLNQLWRVNQTARFYVTSEEIFLSVPQDQLRQTTGERVTIKTTGLDFLVDKLLDTESERFTISVFFVQSVAPVHKAVRDYILLSESKFVWDQLAEEPLIYQESQNSWEQLEIKSASQTGSTLVFYNMRKYSKLNSDDEQLDFREGVRLLVGRFCIFDPKNRCQVCQVVQCNGDSTVMIRSVTTHEIIGKRVHLSKIKLIERYGVSVYDQKYLPQELLQAKFVQLVTIKTQNKRLLNIIQQAIQDQQVALKNKKIELSEQILTASGRLYISVLHAQNLKNSPALKLNQSNQILRPYVRISLLQDNKEVATTALVSEIIEKGENLDDEDDKTGDPGDFASWVNQRHVLGQIFDLGIFQKRIGDITMKPLNVNRTLQIQVYHAKKTGDHILLGTCLTDSDKLVDLQNFASEQSIMLESENRKSGVLTFQTRFVPDWKTQNTFHIVEQSNRLKAPEAYLHFQSLLQLDLIDRFQYRVPLGKFVLNENEFGTHMTEVQSKTRPMILKPIAFYDRAVRQIEQLQSIARSAGRIQTNETLLQNRAKYDKEAFDLAIKKMIYMSQEELRDAEAWGRNPKRPVRQYFTYNHINLWWASKAHSQLDAKLQQGDSVWMQYMERINRQSKSIKEYLRDPLLLEDPTLSFLIQKVKSDSKLISDFEDEDTQPLLHNQLLNKFTYRGNWEQKKEQNYSDLYFLVHQVGIPDTKRSEIWRELLKAQLSELESIVHFKQCFGEQTYNPNITVFKNYLSYCEQFDCLAFDQIDEDVETFEFPNGYLSSLQYEQRQAKFYSERYAIRSLLRVLVVWARKRKVNGQDLCLSYSKGMLEFIQRILSISNANAEDAFWIISGLVQIFPKPFSVPESVLEGDCFSMLRAEMITFKALLEYNLPQVIKKLKQFGLTVETLVYKQILSFHANYFDSDIVLRLWDIMFLSFTTSDPSKQKIGLWYIFSPSYLVLREKQQQILAALSCEEIIQAYQNGCCHTFDPAKFIKDVDIVCEELFVEKTVNKLQNGIMDFFREQKLQAQNLKAKLYDKRREQLQEDVSKLFKVVQLENKHISSFLQVQQPFKANELKSYIVKGISDITGYQAQQLQSQAQEVELPLHSVHVFVHGLNRMPLQQSAYTVKVTLGAINSNSLMFKEASQKMNQTSELANTRSAKKVIETESVSNYYKFDYHPGSNYIKIELFEAIPNGKRLSDAVVSLEEFECDRFASRRVILRNSSILEVTNNFLQSFTQISISIFLQQKQQKQNNYQRIVNSFMRKVPDVVDIFDQTKQEQMSEKFSQLVIQDYRDLDAFLPVSICQAIINDSYNYVNIEGFGYITSEDFIQVALRIFPPSLHKVDTLKRVFDGMTGKLLTPEDAKDILKNQQQTLRQITTSIGIKDVLSTGIQSKLQTIKFDKNGSQNNHSPFSLRQFLITTVMMSHCTVREKLEIIFDIYTSISGQSGDVLQLSKIMELISSVFTRSMYFIPDQELMNLVESLFCDCIGMVRKAYWTKDVKKIMDQNLNKDISLDNFLSLNGKVDLDQEGTSIDVTHEVQKSIMNYIAVFGTKVIDFNQSESPFKKLSDLIGVGATTLLKTTKGGKYKLVLFCQAYSERFTFDVHYSDQGELTQAGNQENTVTKINDIESYFERNSCRLFLNGTDRPISKSEFFDKIESIPMFANLLRVETFFQDRQHEMVKRTGLSVPLVVTCLQSACQLRFEFSSNILEDYEEGSKFETSYQPNLTYTINMHNLYASSLLGDIRQRIISALRVLKSENTKLALPNIEQLELDLKGGRVWQSCYKKEWRTHQDWQRTGKLSQPGQNLIVLKLQCASFVAKDEVQTHEYDCFSLYRNSDQSYQWRPCRIVRRELLPNYKNADIQHDSQSFEYWIEFKHAQHEGKNMWFKRQSSEVLFSKEYTRYQMKGFKRETLSYLLKLYK